MADKVNPFKEGMKAHGEGQVERQNPYKRGTSNWQRWLGGWQYARNQHVNAQAQERRILERAWTE